MSFRITRALVTGSFLVATFVPGVTAAQTTPPSQSGAAGMPTRQATRPAGEQQKPAMKGSPDSSFINEAAEGGMKEVELGKLAQKRAMDSNVKAFAQRMVTDHGKANKELMSLAKSKGITLPSSHPTTSTASSGRGSTGATGTAGTGTSGAATSGTSGATASSPTGTQHGGGDADQLAGLKGVEFDRAYMTHMVDDHEKDVKAFEQESQSGQDPEVKAWAAKQLPTLREHLSQAKSVRDRLPASQ
jgi:putative membrane protein